MTSHLLSRRTVLLGLTTVMTARGVSLAVGAAPTGKRLVVVLLRGALDGLSAVVPYGDPGLMALRPELVPPPPGQDKGLLDLGGKFGLHPALARSHALYQANELLIVHAVAGPTRARSHFEAQDCLESGADHRLNSGWLNRATAAIPPRGPYQSPDQGPGKDMASAIAIGASVPLLLQGGTRVANWAPHGFSEPAPSLYQTILTLNEGDPLTGPAIAAGMRDRGFGGSVTGEAEKGANRSAFPTLAKAAGAMLRAPDGPRIAALELGGWDTHTAQANRIAGPLSQLDQGLDALRTALGDAWRHTAVLVTTEFGRTARMNGTQGTDHGTASVAFLAGGAVTGGQVMGAWPGLERGQLFEDRDLAPMTDLRAIAKGVLIDHIGLNQNALKTVFPGGDSVQPMRGLIRAG